MTIVRSRFFLLPFLLFTASVACFSCAIGTRLNTGWARGADVTGAYTLILYGCNFFDDFETVAILDKEGDQYTFEPFAPTFKYRVERDVSSKKALEKAEKFVHCHTAVQRSQLSRIVDVLGNTIGYEVRPLYAPFAFGFEDVLDIGYWLKDSRVIVRIRPILSIENMLQGDAGKKHR
jgi:hypothetical protein